MTHDEVRVLLPGYAAATLDLADAAHVRAHLVSGCADCLRELFSRPIGLPRPVDAEAPPAPVRHRALAPAILGAVAAVGLAVWAARELSRRETRAARLEARVSRLVRERQRLASLLPHTTDTRARGPKASEPRPRAPDGPGRGPSPEERASAPHEIPADAEPAAPLVRYSPDVLSVQAANVPLGALLEEIGRQSGATVRGAAGGREVSASFERVPLPEALHRLLGEQNFVLVYDEQRRPRSVELLSGAPPSEPADALGEPSPSERVGKSLEATLGLLARHRPVPLDGALAEALGMDAMPLGQLIDTGVHHADRAVRAAAMRASVQALEGDENLRAAVLGTLAAMDDAALAPFVRGMAGEHAEEALFYVATAANGTLRVRAASLLQQIHADTQGTPRADG